MMNVEIRTDQLSEEGLFPRRRLRVGEKTVDTPIKTRPAHKLRINESMSEEARGVVELYQTLDGRKLRQERQGTRDVLVDRFEKGVKKGQADEIYVCFVEFDEARDLDRVEVQYLIDVLDNFSDILTIPLHPSLASSIEGEEGLGSTPYQQLKSSIELFIDVAKQRAPDTPIMGYIPVLGWEFVDDLMGVYERNNIQMYCLDFHRNGRRARITADRQVSMIQPMMRSIARQDSADDIMLYGINMHPGTEDEALGMRPAADMASFGMGLDILGGQHVSPDMPPEAFEDEDDEEATMRLFDEESYAYDDIAVEEIPEHLSDASPFDAEYVVEQATGSEGTQNRLKKLINADLMAQATAQLRSEISDGIAFESVTEKPGITPDTQRAYQEIREEFDNGQEQSALDEFI